MGRAIGRKNALYFDAEDSARRAASYKAESDYQRGHAYALFHKLNLSESDKCEIGKHFRLGKYTDSLPARLQPPAPAEPEAAADLKLKPLRNESAPADCQLDYL